jgi:hypothetical protein
MIRQRQLRNRLHHAQGACACPLLVVSARSPGGKEPPDLRSPLRPRIGCKAFGGTWLAAPWQPWRCIQRHHLTSSRLTGSTASR